MSGPGATPPNLPHLQHAIDKHLSWTPPPARSRIIQPSPNPTTMADAETSDAPPAKEVLYCGGKF
jgi:hypothetical protein